ncbi:MAG: hypothetical protein ABW139_06650 [Candidatus Thiodiazotropha sp. DIVDIV]
MSIFGNGNFGNNFDGNGPFGSNPLGVNGIPNLNSQPGFCQAPGLNPMGGLLPNPNINNSVKVLLGQIDPRDQLAHDSRSFQQSGVGNPGALLNERLKQIDPRDQEAHDIRSVLGGLSGF